MRRILAGCLAGMAMALLATPGHPTEPPARVGRLAALSGPVSFHPQDAGSWEQAVPNYPVTDGAAFWTEPGGRAEIEIAASRIVMDAVTELVVDAIAEAAVVATLPQGEILLALSGLGAGESYTVRTPRAAAIIRTNGRYAIAAGDLNHPTRITVLAGAARVSGAHFALDIGAGQAGVIEGAEDFTARLAPVEPSAFLAAQATADHPALPPETPATGTIPPQQPPAATLSPTPPPTPPTVAQMPGGLALRAHGDWADVPGYGHVWFPRVPSNWQPYRDGRWTWVRPWGWTWIDNAPFGFATTHYGRWLRLRGRWAWWPGPPGQLPVYAPAMVALNGPPGPSGPLRWRPLGAHEPYRPWPGARPARPNLILPPPGPPQATHPPAPGPILFRPLPGNPAFPAQTPSR